MSKKSIRKPLSLVLGAAVLTAAGAASAADEAEGLFGMETLDQTQLTAGGHKEGGCGEGKCGEGEGNCGEDKKDGEGSCGEGKCGGSAV